MVHISDNENERSETREVSTAICVADKALVAAETSRDVELAMSYMAPDVILQPPDRSAVVGREAVREFYAEWFAVPYLGIQVQEQVVTVAASGDLAYLVGKSLLVLNGPQGEQRVPGKYLGVWRKIDSKWKLAAIAWSGDGEKRHDGSSG